MADYCDRPENAVDVPMGLVQEFVDRERAKLAGLLLGRGTEDAMALRVRMQELMTAKVGIFRRGKDLEEAVGELQQLLVRSRDIGVRYKAEGANPELVAAYRTKMMLKLALTVAYGALMRTESRGAHYREDYARRDDAQWLKRTLATWKHEGDTLPTLDYEALDVGRMELPPGWRGYGAKNHVDHPDTAARQQAVDAIREGMKGASRADIQSALLPYEHLLPAKYRGPNERVDEPLPPRGAALQASSNPRSR
jgi:fumarate reductase flavoprotein subunit